MMRRTRPGLGLLLILAAGLAAAQPAAMEPDDLAGPRGRRLAGCGRSPRSAEPRGTRGRQRHPDVRALRFDRERPRFYLGPARKAPETDTIWVVNVPRRPFKIAMGQATLRWSA